MKQLISVPANMSCTKMCIYVDNEMYKPDCDYEIIYKYMWCIAYIIACKKKYFSDKRSYEELASIVANSTFKRMTDTSKSRIKSVLNYINSIIGFRKCAYEAQRHQEVINPEINTEWDGQQYLENLRETLEAKNRSIIEDYMKDLISYTPSIIKSCIPQVYVNDKPLYLKLYKSSLLTMLNRFTLPEHFLSQIDDKLDNPNFSEVKYYRKHLDDTIILWHLPEEYKNVVTIIINKTIRQLTEEIKSLTSDNEITDDELSYIASSSYTPGGQYETNN